MKAIVITGSGSGIGHGLTAELLERGYQVFAGAVDDSESQTLAQNFSQYGDSCIPLVFDVRDTQSCIEAARRVAQALDGRRITALLNIAGVTVNGPLADLDPAAFGSLLDVNLVGMLRVTQAFLPLLGTDPSRRGPPGRIINMSSQSGKRTMPFAVAYSASKFGVEALSAGLRRELYPFGIQVAVIAPGLVATPMAARILTQLQESASLPAYSQPLHRFREKAAQAIKHGIPVTRVVHSLCEAIESPRPKYRYEIHNNYWRDTVMMGLLPARWLDARIARALGLLSGASQFPDPKS